MNVKQFLLALASIICGGVVLGFAIHLTSPRPAAPPAVVHNYAVTIGGVPMSCTLSIDAYGNGTLNDCVLRASSWATVPALR